MKTSWFHQTLTLIIGLLVSLTIAQAQGWPNKTITIVVPYEAGGGHDAMARILAEGLTEKLGQSVIVVNKTGASGMIGAEFVTRAAPDGYTILFASPSETVNAKIVYKKMRYDPEKNLEPVTLAGTSPLVFVASPSNDIKTLGDLIAQAKSNPGLISFGTAGSVGTTRLTVELLKKIANIEMTHIPYKGAALATNDVLAGQISIAIVGMAPVMSHIRSGKLVPLAITQRSRLTWAKDIPAASETPGLQGFEAVNWMGVFLPSKTPTNVLDHLQREIVAVLREPERRNRLIAMGIDPVGNTPSEFKTFLVADRERFLQMFQASGLKPE